MTLPPEYFDTFPEYVGLPLNSLKVKILNKNGEEVKKREAGALYISGDSVMDGYYEGSELTNEILKDGWLCTGDIAIKNSSGFIKILGGAMKTRA